MSTALQIPCGPDNSLLLLEGGAPETIRWRTRFVASAPVEIEVGCGSGTFLRESALARPERVMVGIEQSSKWARCAASTLATAGISNALVIRSEAVDFLRTCVADCSVEGVHVYFPDPWPRKRHEKRRIWRPEFVDEITRVIIPSGRILAATDIKAYFVTIQGLLSRQPDLVQQPLPRGLPITTFARKFLDRGRPVFATMFVKATGLASGEEHGA